MRFLIDNALPSRFADGLCAAGHDAIHVHALELSSADDDVVFDRAASEGRALVSLDSDFGAILAMRGVSTPSVILFRGRTKSTEILLLLLLLNLPAIQVDLDAGSIAVFEDTRIRVRRLPIHISQSD